MYSRHILFDQTMAESTSSPSIPRSSHRPLEYTSCIDPKPLSISTCGNVNAHSSFDTISQPRHENYLPTINLPQHRILERESRRLYMDSDRYTTDKNTTNKKLDRTESISLPSTPIEQISSPFNHTSRSLLALESNDDDDDDDDNNNNNNNNNKGFSLLSSTDYMIATSEQLAHQSMTNPER
jgi:hypothetical protein